MKSADGLRSAKADSYNNDSNRVWGHPTPAQALTPTRIGVLTSWIDYQLVTP